MPLHLHFDKYTVVADISSGTLVHVGRKDYILLSLQCQFDQVPEKLCGPFAVGWFSLQWW